MLKKSRLLLLALAAMLVPTSTQAADHIDAPAAVAEPAADITDLFAWTSADATKLNLVLDVSPFAGPTAAFSDAVQYVFHINSSAAYGEAATETLILCQFDAAGAIECWAGDDEYVTGDASAEAGLASESAKFKVFAGQRNDPFFMEFTGFTETVAAVVEAAPSLTFDGNGCPALDAQTSGVLVGQLQSGAKGAAATDTFAGANVLSIVVEVDKTLVNSGGPILGVWSSTHTR